MDNTHCYGDLSGRLHNTW